MNASLPNHLKSLISPETLLSMIENRTTQAAMPDNMSSAEGICSFSLHRESRAVLVWFYVIISLSNRKLRLGVDFGKLYTSESRYRQNLQLRRTSSSKSCLSISILLCNCKKFPKVPGCLYYQVWTNQIIKPWLVVSA